MSYWSFFRVLFEIKMKLSYVQKNILKWVIWFVVIVVIGYIYFRYPFYKFFPNIHYLFFMWIAGLFLLVNFFGFVSIQLGKWQRGSEAEKEVEDVSYELPENFIILRNIVPGRIGNIDEVIVGPTGIWVVEVKSHTGKITFDGRELRRDNELFEKDFLKQVWKEVYALGDILKNELKKDFFIQPVICFSDSDAELHFGLKPIKGVYVIGLDWLKKLILRGLHEKLNQRQIKEIVRVLRKYKE